MEKVFVVKHFVTVKVFQLREVGRTEEVMLSAFSVKEREGERLVRLTINPRFVHEQIKHGKFSGSPWYKWKNMCQTMLLYAACCAASHPPQHALFPYITACSVFCCFFVVDGAVDFIYLLYFSCCLNSKLM